ncbi:MAG: xylose isomerase, partial [Balneolaceae bacterium]
MSYNNFFPKIKKIKYEGPNSDNPLAFTHYQEDRVVAGKAMKDHFRFAVAYWHSFCNENSDPFGTGTRRFPWDKTDNPIENARFRVEAAFEFFTKLGVPFYCFHDRDLAPEGKSIASSEKNLQELVSFAKQHQ